MRLSFTWKIAILISVAIVLVTSVASAMSINAFSTSLQEELEDTLVVGASHTMDKVSNFLWERQKDVETFSKDDVFQKQGAWGEKRVRLSEIMNDTTVYHSMSLYNPAGVEVVNTEGLLEPTAVIPENQIHDEFHRQNSDNIPYLHTPFHGGLYIDSRTAVVDGERIMRFSSPILSDDGALRGILVARVSSSTIEEIIRAPSLVIGSEGLTMHMVSKEGILQFTTDESATLGQDMSGLPIFDSIRRSLRDWETFEGDAFLYSAVKEQDVFDYRSNGWVLILQQDKETAFEPLHALRSQMLTIIGAVALLSLLIGYLLAYPATRGIRSVANTIDRISRGDLSAKVDPKVKKRKDEIGQLARAFDRTIVSLKMAMEDKDFITEDE